MDILTGLDPMGGEGMPDHVAAHMFDDVCLAHRFPDRALEYRFVNVVSPLSACLDVLPAVLLQEAQLSWMPRGIGLHGVQHEGSR